MKSMIYHRQQPWAFRSGHRLFNILLSTLALAICSGWQSVQATPVFHGIAAANVNVQQNDTGNTTASVTLTAPVAINDFRISNGSSSGNSRADYFVQIGPVAANNATNGILISSITDNGRDNGEGTGTSYGTCGIDSNASGNPGSAGQWWVPVFGSLKDPAAGTYTYPEYNFDFAAAYFSYAKGWYGGWLVNKGGTNNGVGTTLAFDHWIGNTNMVLGVNIIPQGGGKEIVNLLQFGLDSRVNAILLCCGGKNEENFADSQTNADGTWTVTCRDDISGGAEADPSAFVCIPLTNHMIVSGRFMGDASIAMQSAPFSVTNSGSGTYHLTIPGVTPGHGVLIISGEEGGTYNGDNFVSYQATADGWDIQTRDTGTGPNLQSLPGSDAVVSFAYIPAPTPGFAITPTNGLVTSESGVTASFTVALDAAPTAEVDFNFSSTDPTAGQPTVSTLAFQPANWNVPQTVTVTGVSNTLPNGGIQPYSIAFSPVTSTDTNYNGMQPPSVSLVNVENNLPGITVWPTNGLATTEAGGTATFYVFLDSQPTTNVTIGVTSSDTTEGVLATSALTFNSTNWNVAQPVTVTGTVSNVVAGNIPYTIITAPAVSGDANYNDVDAADVSLVNLGTVAAGINISAGNTLAVIEGGTTNFTLALSAPPVGNVTINLSSGNPSAGTVSPAALNFTPVNWSAPQTVTLSGVANSANGGNVSYPISLTASSAAPGYSTLVVSNLNATTLATTGIILPSGLCVYGLGMAPVGIDGLATVTNYLEAAYSGASISFTLTTNGDAGDTLSIRNDGTADGLIGVTGNTVSYSGSAMGTVTGGTGSTPLVITLQNGTPSEAVQALVRAVSFRATSPSALAQRSVRVAVNDGLGDTAIADKNIRVGLLRIMQFQDGADYGYGTYANEADIEILQSAPSTAYPAGVTTNNGILVTPATSAESQALLRFDNLIGTNANQIPPGAIIVSADLNLNILNSGDGWAFNRMLIPWDATNATWNSFSDQFGDYGVYADDVTAQSETDSQLGAYVVNLDGTVSTTAGGTGNVTIGVTPDIQAWANGQANYGWVFNPLPQLTDATGFSPSEDPALANRPRLRVYWVPAGTPSATFRYGVNGYTNVYDTDITQASPDNTNPTATTIWSDGNSGVNDITETLLQFDNIIGTATNQIPSNAHIEVAMLNLASVNSGSAMGDGGQFFAMLEPWQDTNTTWNSWGVNGIQNDGVEAAITATVTAGSPTLSPNVQGGFHAFEVTPDVQNWVNGTLPNDGWGVIPWPHGSDGWGMDSSEDPTEVNRPELVVYYTATGTPPGPIPLTITSVSTTQVQMRFGGAAGTSYSIWRTDALTGIWTAIGTAMVGTNGMATFTDAAPLPTAAFYRVRP